MKQRFYFLPVAVLSVILLVSCSSGDDSSKVDDNHNDAPAAEENNDGDQADNDKHEEDNDVANQDGTDNGESGDETSDKPNENKNSGSKDNVTSMSDQLKIDDTNIKQPTDFPVDEDVTATIGDNTSSAYTIDYQTESNQDVATFTGTLYETANDAKSNLDEFRNEKEVPKRDDTEKDLGHGIKGYGEGTAGHAHFGWKEGNWALAIQSVSADEMNNPAIAKKMVDYLESHALPAPKAEGVVFVSYPEGGDSVDVDIRWQENKMVYQLKTNKVPLDALEMATSVK